MRNSNGKGNYQITMKDQAANSVLDLINNYFSGMFNSLLLKMSKSARGRKRLIGMLVDGSLATLCIWAAWSLRAGKSFTDLTPVWYLFVLMPVITVSIFAALGVYRWVIRSTNQLLFRQLAKGAALASMGLVVIMHLLPPENINPRSVFILYGLVLFVSTCGVRVLWRTLFDTDRIGAPIAIYGAGSAGQQLVSLLNKGSEFRPVMFIDDDRSLAKRSLYGLPVVHGYNVELRNELSKREITKVVLAMPSLSSAEYHNKIQLLSGTDVPVLTMPSLQEIMAGAAKVDEIRDISIADILGRSEVAADVQLMGRRVIGKTVLVTGGGGSIGSEICRQVMKLAPRQLIILDNCEANLYHITEELSDGMNRCNLVQQGGFKSILGSVLDEARISKLIRDHGVDTIFHAAAYKHVPIVEAQPDQGVEVNVFGTQTVLDCAIAKGVSDFVLISTDKAVRPTNAMGASKRVAELVLQARAAEQSITRISMVRFGNVLGSSGSVVPKFKRQILGGGPITLTHPEVTRYFMTIPEASQLVLQASAIAKGGDVFVLDMGEPVRILDLATTMVKLYGKKLQQDSGDEGDISIVVEGLRPGEKLFEELFISDSHQSTEVSKISSTSELWLEWEVLKPRLDKLKRFAQMQDSAAIRSILLSLAFVGENNAGLAGSDGAIKFDSDTTLTDAGKENKSLINI